MDFAHTGPTTSKTATRVAFVGLFHVVLAIGLIHTMTLKKLSHPDLPPPLIVDWVPVVPPVLIPETTYEPAMKPPLPVFIPPETDIQQEPAKPTITTRRADENPPAVLPGVGPTGSGDVTPHIGANTVVSTEMHTAVLADASACQKPSYPTAAARNGDTGTVTLALLVGTDGRVADSKIQKTSGYRDLDRAARNALSLCQFKAATTNGVPQQAWAQMNYVWTLE